MRPSTRAAQPQQRYAIARIARSLCVGVIVFSAGILLTGATHAEPLQVSSDAGNLAIGRHVDYLEDPNGEYNLADVQTPPLSEQFKRSTEERINFSYTPSTYWFRLQLTTDASRELPVLLELVSLIDDVRIYVPDADGEYLERRYGRWRPLEERDLKHRNFLFRFTLPPNEIRTIYMRFQSEGALLLPLTLWTVESFAAKDHEEQIVFGLYFGVLLVMVLYNSFLFVWLRDTGYFYYVAYILSFGLILSGVWGFSHEYVFSWNMWLANRSIPIFIGTSSFFALQFTRKFLETKTRHPRLHIVILIIAGLAAAQTIYAIFGNYGLAVRAGTYIALGACLMLFAAPVISLISGNRAARYFLLAFIALIVGVVVILLRNLGVLPYNFLTNYSSLIGSAMEVVLLSLALGDRFNLIRAEKERIQLESLQKERRLNEAFARFVPTTFLELLEKQGIVDVQPGDAVRRDLAILFADIRSFTDLSENMSAEDNFHFINAYLRRMNPVIREHGGFIDKYIGDAVMALFPGSAAGALRAGLAMRQALNEYNVERSSKGMQEIDIGIGIHYGSTMLGTVGDAKRMDGTVISDAVNVASRLEGLTKKFATPIIVSEAVLKESGLRDEIRHRFLGEVEIRGKKERTAIYTIDA